MSIRRACGAASSGGSARCRRDGRRGRRRRARADRTARGRRPSRRQRGVPVRRLPRAAARHPDVAALDVAAILLGESESARLPRRLRDRDRLVTGAYAHVHALRDPGLFVLSATARARDAQKSVGALVDQALALVDDLTPDELDKARIAAEAGPRPPARDRAGPRRALGWNASLTGDPRFAHVYLDRIRAVRRHDVAAAVHRYFRPDNASVAAILPKPRGHSARDATFARSAEKRVRTRARASRRRRPRPSRSASCSPTAWCCSSAAIRRCRSSRCARCGAAASASRMPRTPARRRCSRA